MPRPSAIFSSHVIVLDFAYYATLAAWPRADEAAAVLYFTNDNTSPSLAPARFRGAAVTGAGEIEGPRSCHDSKSRGCFVLCFVVEWERIA